MSINVLYAAFNTKASTPQSSFDQCFRLPGVPVQRGLREVQKSRYLPLVQTALFALRLAAETADAILAGEYKKFDALVKNCGCQITAAQVFNIVRNPTCPAEARLVKEQVQKVLARVQDEKFEEDPPPIVNVHPFVYLVDHLKLGFPVSANFAQLIRFRILKIVNNNLVKEIPIPYLNKTEHREVPETNLETVKERFPVKGHTIIKSWIKEVQMEESVVAKLFVQCVAKKAVENPRWTLFARMVSDQHVRSTVNRVESTPQSFNSELAYSEIEKQGGLVLVKRKLMLGNTPVPGATPIKIFVRAQKDQVPLTTEEVKALDPKEPIWVVEGYMGTSLEELVNRVNQIGVKELLFSTIAFLDQYVGGTSQADLEDPEACSYVEHKKDKRNLLFFEPEHVYTGSVGEER